MGTVRLTPSEFLAATREVFDGLVVEEVSGVERGEWLRALGRLESMVLGVRSRLVAARSPVGAGLVGAAERSAELVRAAGVSQREARRSVRVAEALAESPVMAEALAAGEVTAGHVEALAFGVDRLERGAADADAGLQAAARDLPVDGFRAVVEEWQRGRSGDVDGRRVAERQRRRRRAGWRTMPDGMVRLEADLAPDAGAVVAGELGRLAEGLWRSEDGRAAEPGRGGRGGRGVRTGDGLRSVVQRSVVQRNADALVEMARRSSAGGAGGGSPEAGVPVRSRADIVCVVDEAALRAGLSGRCETADGVALTPTQLRRLACDARVLPAVLDGNGQVLDLGRSSRTVSPAQRTALIVRDGGCIFPGCDRPPSWCDAHHIIHWLSWGPTDLWNLCLLCSTHHHIVHDGAWTLQHVAPAARDGRILFTDPHGRTHQPDRRKPVSRRPAAA